MSEGAHCASVSEEAVRAVLTKGLLKRRRTQKESPVLSVRDSLEGHGCKDCVRSPFPDLLPPFPAWIAGP